MFYIVHVVKRYQMGFGIFDREGEWVLERFNDLTLADIRCSQLNDAMTLTGHHWYEVRENVEGIAKSELCCF